MAGDIQAKAGRNIRTIKILRIKIGPYQVKW